MSTNALATLQFARKIVARDIEKVLRSAIANAQQKEGFGGDVDRLFVAACFANQGPSMKRIRPAPMGRAFRVVKRTAHLTVRSPSGRQEGERCRAGSDAAAAKRGEGQAPARRPRQPRDAERRTRRPGQDRQPGSRDQARDRKVEVE